MSNEKTLATLSIFDVVRQPGGNGLASPLFEMPSEFFRIFSWQHIEVGTEALIVDGEIVRQSDGILNPFGMLLRRQYARRVLLRPAPLTDIRAHALTKDQLDLTLTVSVNYLVRDPKLVASMEAPIHTLTQLVTGITAEYIRGERLEDIVHDDGLLRTTLRDRLNVSPSLRDAFEIIEVLKALPTGDERLIEIARQTRAEKARTTLIGAQGKNLLAEAQVALEITRMHADMDEQRKAADHQRVMVIREAELKAQNLQSMAAAMALAASSGGDTAKLADMFLNLIGKPNIAPSLPDFSINAEPPSAPESPASDEGGSHDD